MKTILFGGSSLKCKLRCFHVIHFLLVFLYSVTSRQAFLLFSASQSYCPLFAWLTLFAHLYLLSLPMTPIWGDPIIADLPPLFCLLLCRFSYCTPLLSSFFRPTLLSSLV